MTTMEDLIKQGKALATLAPYVQNEEIPQEERDEKLNGLNEQYHQWYHIAISVIDKLRQLNEYKNFEHAYNGSFVTNGIIKFLTGAFQLNPLYNEEKPTGIPKWRYPYNTSFQEPLYKQINILASLRGTSVTSIQDTEEWNLTIRRVFQIFVDKANQAENNNAKKLAYEYLALFLMASIPGFTVVGHDTRGASSEIDLSVMNESQNPMLRDLGGFLIVECKNWSIPVDAATIRNLSSVMENKNVTTAILLSRKGVTGNRSHDAILEIHNAFGKGRKIIVIDEKDLLDLVNKMTPAEKLKEKRVELFLGR